MLIKQKTILAFSLAGILLSPYAASDLQQQNGLAIRCQPSSQTLPVTGELSDLVLVGTSVADSPFATSAAEIVSYDSCTDLLYVVNAQAKQVDILTMNEQGKPAAVGAIHLQSAANAAGIEIGAANSVSTYGGLVAVAIENANKQANGLIALYRSDNLKLIATYPTGALPDMVSFSKDGRYIATANEGEPNANYQVDPEGSITLVDLVNGPANANVQQIHFNAFNKGEVRHNELPTSVRISGPNASVAQDLEPEYLSFADNGKLYVTLQENNALAVIDVATARVDTMVGLGGKSWANVTLDASNKDKKMGNFKSYSQLESLYMPDGIASYTVNGNTYLVTANEGDSREYGFETTQQVCDESNYTWDEDDYAGTPDYTTKVGYCIAHIDEVRGKKLKVDNQHPLAEALQDKKQLARLKVVQSKSKVDANNPVYAFGSRSFSIWDDKGKLTFDSGNQFSQTIFALEPRQLNSTHNNNQSGDNRSDDRGGEPEVVEVASINDRHYAFIGLERQGGVMVYDITDPTNGRLITYVNNRHYDEDICTEVKDGDCKNSVYNPSAGDLGPESIEYFQRQGKHYLAVSNEVSGTTSVYQLRFKRYR
ncbi:choice-of-anchor I family protein [Spartinivicinus poritis]|uniref:Choice-of-anchor I family protein n=1 Tax=Spartinivicinus poritis TaxID=2994640 RepID=A0ABT5UDQ7_9GAMM|nr:choice-of-anchor I family protein [Spartinivicinus sp. A2-2]MDE1464514.1 choice-of-anchor I family protein [Spartinivicinus sp. A2-2]